MSKFRCVRYWPLFEALPKGWRYAEHDLGHHSDKGRLIEQVTSVREARPEPEESTRKVDTL